MDHSHHVAASGGGEWFAILVCYLVSWGLAAWTAWDGREDWKQPCRLACIVKFATMPPFMHLAGWWGMTASVALGGAIMFAPQLWFRLRGGK